jgi:hypothetical protein
LASNLTAINFSKPLPQFGLRVVAVAAWAVVVGVAAAKVVEKVQEAQKEEVVFGCIALSLGVSFGGEEEVEVNPSSTAAAAAAAVAVAAAFAAWVWQWAPLKKPFRRRDGRGRDISWEEKDMEKFPPTTLLTALLLPKA